MSKREFLAEKQPVFFQTIKNSFEQHKVPHAFLIVGPKGSTISKAVSFLAQSLVCEEDLACEKCNSCLKIENNNFIDLVRIDGLKETIKKGMVEEIQKQFQKTSVEGLGKIYILENIENSTPETMNALLKILEEPTDKTYAIFTCENTNKVLPTIISRCQVLVLKPLPLEYNDYIGQINEEDFNILSNYYETIDEMKELVLSDRYIDIKKEALAFIEDYYTKKENALINIQLNLLKKYKEKEDIELFLDLLILLLKDIEYNNGGFPIVFINHKEVLEMASNSALEMVEKVLETKARIKSNANVSLLIDSLIYNL